MADFEGENDTDAREIIQRDAFEVMKTVLAEIDNAAAPTTQAAAGVEGKELR